MIAAGPAAAQEPILPENIDWTTCAHKGLGFQILCGSRWPVQAEEQGINLVISQTEKEWVQVSISKSQEKGLFFEDLVPSAMQRVYGYADGFQYDRLDLNGRPTVKIVGMPQSEEKKIFMDYFLLAGTQLYRISFTADSGETLKRYEPLFMEMIKSFDFIGFPE